MVQVGLTASLSRVSASATCAPWLVSEASFLCNSKRVHIHYNYGIIGPKNHNGDGLLGPNSIMAVYTDSLALEFLLCF